MQNLFRTDGWVKTTLGPAVPGTQVFVCTQPANSTFPPSPLAAIFSDPGGLAPITQPILTDGFGHYDFYTLPGVYTLVVAFNGLVQQVYPDQSIGGIGSGGGGTALLLETNGASNGNQTLLNLTGSGSVSVVDAGDGTVTITGSGTLLETNGTTNTVQNVLNLVNGTGMSLASDGFGGVTLTCTVTSGGNFVTAGQAFFWGPGLLGPQFGQSQSTLSFGGNTVYAYKFMLESTFTIRNCSYIWHGNIGSNTGINFGIYDVNGNLLLDSGPFDVSTAVDTVNTHTFGGVTFQPGVYYFAEAIDNAGLSAPNLTFLPSPTGAAMAKLINAVATNAVTAANSKTAGTSGAMPATLGALTAITDITTVPSIAMPLWTT